MQQNKNDYYFHLLNKKGPYPVLNTLKTELMKNPQVRTTTKQVTSSFPRGFFSKQNRITSNAAFAFDKKQNKKIVLYSHLLLLSILFNLVYY